MSRTSAFIALAVVGASAPALAETLRCGSSLVQEGDTQGYVQDKCGEPDSKQTYTEPVLARRENGTTYEVGTTTRDVWRYKRGSGSFPAVLTFEKGMLKKLEFEK
jgi:uncharacterized protein DUF2845